MAKDRNAAQRRRVKLNDNAYASTLQHKNARHPLTCKVAGCDKIALVIKPANALGQHKRVCRPHFITPPQKENDNTKRSEIADKVLKALGLI